MLETIIEYQNAKFENLSYFSKVFGRAELITVNQKYAPWCYIGDGNYVGVSDFDEYGGSLYWRKTGKVTVTDISDTSMIANKKVVQVSIPMRIVVTIPKGKLSDDDVYAGERIANTLIRTVQENNIGLKNTISARKLIFEISGWEDDPQEVKKQEYSGRELTPGWVYLALDINILIDADASCLSTECEYYVTNNEILNTICNQSCESINLMDFDLRDSLQCVSALKTGQTTSYHANDAKAITSGRLVDWFTLSCANSFGNTNRFTDITGGQSYGNDIFLDWATGYMWYRGFQSDTWSNAINTCIASNQGGFSGWGLPTKKEYFELINDEFANAMNYSPVMLASSLWTITTYKAVTTSAWYIGAGGDVNTADKGVNVAFAMIRRFTLAELGL